MASTSADTTAPTVPGLAFRRKGGPLAAVVSLCGGAGASSLTALCGVAAARASTVPVLACDTGGPTAGLAAYAGSQARLSLAEGSTRLAAGERVAREDLFAHGAEGLRVMASGPNLTDGGDSDVVARILGDARLAHGLTLVDCATLARPIERHALERATHILWMLPATVSGVRRAERVLGLVRPKLPGGEIVVARYEAAERKPPMRELTALAAERGGALVLMPHIPDLAEAHVDDAVEAAEVALQAIGELLHR